MFGPADKLVRHVQGANTHVRKVWHAWNAAFIMIVLLTWHLVDNLLK